MDEMELASRGPLRGEALLAFLATRAIPGLESAGPGWFRRNVTGGWIELSLPATDDSSGGSRDGSGNGSVSHLSRLILRHQLDSPDRLVELVPLIRRVADLDTDLEPIACHLATDDELARRLSQVPLARLPGTFDPFELAIRAVVGQQVSVAAARTLLGRLVTIVAAGPDAEPDPATPIGVTEVSQFPSADAVAACTLAALGMPARRRATILTVARAVADGQVDLSPGVDGDQLRHQLVALPGIGPWTAGYIAMRALSDPDGWPAGDLVLRQSLGTTAAELERRAARWRPWRAYAALLLWHTAH